MLGARLTSAGSAPNARRRQLKSGRSSGVEHNLAKVGVEGSNPFARSSFATAGGSFETGAHERSEGRQLSRLRAAETI